jgi:hypothetical protein
MNWNVALSVLIAMLTLAGAGLAGQLAATKRWHKIFFWGTGLLAVILIFIQTRLNEGTQEQLKAQLNQIQKNTERTSSIAFTDQKEITFRHDLKTITPHITCYDLKGAVFEPGETTMKDENTVVIHLGVPASGVCSAR